MREIKFRFFRTKTKEMVYGFPHCSTTHVLGMWENEKHVSTPMQYTGLTDKNGREIYEGDILRFEGYTDMFVEFVEGEFVTKSTIKVQRINWQPLRLIAMVEKGYEVIGNIYENPELLEGETNA